MCNDRDILLLPAAPNIIKKTTGKKNTASSPRMEKIKNILNTHIYTVLFNHEIIVGKFTFFGNGAFSEVMQF